MHRHTSLYIHCYSCTPILCDLIYTSTCIKTIPTMTFFFSTASRDTTTKAQSADKPELNVHVCKIINVH